MDAENGDCTEAEKCKEGNEVDDVDTTVSHEHTVLDHGESDCTAVDDILLNKAENVWKPKIILSMRRGGEEAEENNPEQQKTQELFKRIRSILNKLIPQTFQQLMKQVFELPIGTEERLKGVVDLTFEKAISEPDYSVAYANMCRCLMGLKVPAKDKPGTTLNFRNLMLDRCENEFEKNIENHEIFEKKQKELEAASNDEERQRLTEELEEAKDKEHRRSIGNIQFIGELFKLKMLTEGIMHDCIVELLKKTHDEESLECLCRLLSTIGKDLDSKKAKPRMDQYFNQMDEIIKERKTSSKTRFMLQDVLDLRRNNWVPGRGNQGLKTIDHIHKESKTGGSEGWMGRGEREGPWRRGGPHSPGRGPHSPGRGPHSPGRGPPPQDESWNTVSICKNRPINTSRFSKFTKTPVGRLDFNNQLLAPGGKGMWRSWGKGRSTSTDPANTGGRPATSTLNRFSALQSSSPVSFLDSDRRVPQSILSQKFQQLTKQVIELTIDTEERLKEVIDLTFEKAISEPDFSVAYVDMCRCLMGLKVPATDKPRTTVNFRKLLLNRCQKEFENNIENNEIFEKKQKELEAASSDEERQRLTEELEEAKDKEHRRSLGSIQFIGELFKVKMLTAPIMHDCIVTLIKIPYNEESLECLCQLLSTTGKELDHGMARPRMDYYFNQMDEIIKESKTSSKIRFMLQDVLDQRRNNWVPRRGNQGLKTIDQIHKERKTGGSGGWMEAGEGSGERGRPHTPGRGPPPQDESWNTVPICKITKSAKEKDSSSEEDVSHHHHQSSLELMNHLSRLIQDQANNQRIFDWIQANLDEKQTSSNMFVRALMTCICQSAIIYENPYKVSVDAIKQRRELLWKFLKDEQKELQVLYALQALMVQMEQPANLLHMFFDALYDEDVIKEEAFYKWESSKDLAEQTGKGVALKSVTAFFTWLREAEDESDNS